LWRHASNHHGGSWIKGKEVVILLSSGKGEEKEDKNEPNEEK
jgi:hypothetical protein